MSRTSTRYRVVDVVIPAKTRSSDETSITRAAHTIAIVIIWIGSSDSDDALDLVEEKHDLRGGPDLLPRANIECEVTSEGQREIVA